MVKRYVNRNERKLSKEFKGNVVETLPESHAIIKVNGTDYLKMSKEDLIKIIEYLKSHTKFGLVWDWEKTKEQFEIDITKYIPILQECLQYDIITNVNKIINILIEGDNYHALSSLLYSHSGKIDVIYIDPPYNRGVTGKGSSDFKYNDNYVDSEDTYRHSKWLSFMSKRLKLAKELLSDDGVMFISIDDNEYAQLKMLSTSIFGERNVDTMIWRKSGEGRDGKMKNTTTFRKDHEYIIVIYKNNLSLNKLLEKPIFKSKVSNPDNDIRGNWFSGSISRTEKDSNQLHENFYSVKSPNGIIITRQFDVSKKEFLELDKDNKIYWGKDGKSIPRVKIFPDQPKYVTPYSLLLNKGTTSDGKNELKKMFGKEVFDTPKPIYLLKTLIQIASNKNSIILDFFAGSGSTGHAVLELNEEDGGKRQFILCTNNENNICKDVTYQRIKKVIMGYKDSDGSDIGGVGGNLKYYKTDFVEKSLSKDISKDNLINKCNEMICIKENVFNKIKSGKNCNIYKNGDKHLIIYHGYGLDDESLTPLKKELNKLNGEKILYCFTLDPNGIDINNIKDFGNVRIESVPQKILDIYESVYRGV